MERARGDNQLINVAFGPEIKVYDKFQILRGISSNVLKSGWVALIAVFASDREAEKFYFFYVRVLVIISSRA